MSQRIAIIGAGIAGLTAGVYARKAGFETTIFEKNSVPGGECTGWDRSGFHIDNCIHWMMGTRPGSHLHSIWQETGAITPATEIISSNQMYTSELNHQSITLWKDIDRTLDELRALSPMDNGPIKELIDCAYLARNIQIPAEKPPELLGLIDAIKLSGTLSKLTQLQHRCVNMDTRDMAQRFQHPLIRALICDFCTPESRAVSFPMAYGNFVGGDGGVPRGGSRAMALRMAARFAELGGTLRTSAPVARINVQGARALNLTLGNGSVHEFDYAVCACDTAHTFGTLLDESYMGDMMRDMYSNRAAYPVYGMFQVAFAVDSPIDALGGDIIMPCPELKFNEHASERITVKTFAYEPSFAPTGQQILQTMQGMSEAAYPYWLELARTPEAYNAKKAELAQLTMQLLERRFPQYAGKLTVLDTWTPITYSRWCNAYKGYNQAFTPTKTSISNPYPPAKIERLSNAYLAGQWLNPPGGLPGAAVTGKFAIQRILHAEKRSIKI